MKQVVVRVCWPQQEQDVAQWQCELDTLPSAVPSPVVGEAMTLTAAIALACDAQQGEGAEVTLLLPAELGLLDSVQLPARSQRQAMQALPFVVEEQLAQDLEEVHLAVDNRRPDGRWPVLVMNLAIMATVFDLAEQAGVALKAVHVDAQLLPGGEAQGQLAILMHDDRVLLRTPQLVTALDLASAGSMIHLLVGETAFSQVSIRYQAGHEQQALLAQQLATEYTALGETQASTDTYEGSLGLALVAQPVAAIDLLQGRFAVKQRSAGLAWWHVAAAVFLFAWLGQLGLQLTSGFYFERQAAINQKLTEHEYRKLFPDARQVSNPRKRVESRLAGSGETGGANFAALFGSCVQALNSLADRDGLTIEQLRFEAGRGQLELELKAKTIDQLDQYKQALGKLGLEGRISSANDNDGAITGRMQIAYKGA